MGCVAWLVDDVAADTDYTTETLPFVQLERSSQRVMVIPKFRRHEIETVVEPWSFPRGIFVVEGNEHELMVGDDESKMNFM